jgi:hypothetical protein
MPTDGAPGGRTDQTVVAGDVTRYTADRGALQTTFRGRHSRQGQHWREERNKDKCLAHDRALFETDEILKLWRRRAPCNASGTRRSVV